MADPCLLIGLGQIGMGYDLEASSATVRSHAHAFSLHPAFELVAAVDASAERGDIFEKRYGGNAFSDVAEALNTVDPALVVIATPTHSHLGVLQEVLVQSQPRVILCEKPLAYELGEAEEMVACCSSASVELFVNYIRRADPGVQEVKRRIGSGEFGGPVKGNVWYSKGFLNNGSHFFDLLEFWLGNFVRAELVDGGPAETGHDCEPDVRVVFNGGSVIFQAAWGESFSHNSLELLSPNGRIRYEEGGHRISWQSVMVHPDLAGYRVLANDAEIIPNDMKRYQWNVADQLAKVFGRRPHSLCTGKQALKSLQAMYEIVDKRPL